MVESVDAEDAIESLVAPIKKGSHWVQPHAVSITQATELGRVYTPAQVAEIAELAHWRGMKLHMDGARFANAVAFLECSPAAVSCDAGVDALSFGCVKNGAMSAEAIVFFDRDLAEDARLRHKRGGHLQSKGRYLAAQLLAMIEDGLWLDNAQAANAAAAMIARKAADRLIEPAETNQLFLRMTAAERNALRAQGFAFYDHGPDGARFVTAWDNYLEDCEALGKAIAAL